MKKNKEPTNYELCAAKGVYPNYKVSIALVREDANGVEGNGELLKGEKYNFYGEHNATETFNALKKYGEQFFKERDWE